LLLLLLILLLLLLVLVHITEQKVSACSAAVWLIAVCRETVSGDRCVLFQAEVWNIDVAAKSSEYSDVQLSAGDVLPGRKVIDEHTKVVDAVSAGFTCYGRPLYFYPVVSSVFFLFFVA